LSALRAGTISTSNVETGAPSTTAATPPTRTKRTRWRRRVSRIPTKLYERRGTAQGGNQIDMGLERLKTFVRAELQHPSDESAIDGPLTHPCLRETNSTRATLAHVLVA